MKKLLNTINSMVEDYLKKQLGAKGKLILDRTEFQKKLLAIENAINKIESSVQDIDIDKDAISDEVYDAISSCYFDNALYGKLYSEEKVQNAKNLFSELKNLSKDE